MSPLHPFGWDYPAGAENDPNAPWNQTEDHYPTCKTQKDEEADCDCDKIEASDRAAFAEQRRDLEDDR